MAGLPGDDPLVRRLRTMYDEVDPVPEHVIEAAIAAAAWRTLDDELMALLTDSALDPAGVRGDDGPRLLTFGGETGSVEVEISAGSEGIRLIGFLLPAATAAVTVRHGGGEAQARADEAGRFRVTGIRPGPVSLVVVPEGAGSRLVTEWLAL